MKHRLHLHFSLDRAVDLGVLAVLVLAHFNPDTAAPIEVGWGALGAGGVVFAAHVLRHRVSIDNWRRRSGYNGIFKLTSEGHVVLRAIALLIQVLIVISGVVSMLTVPAARDELQLKNLIVSLCVLGIGAASTIGAWYAERNAEAQIDWVTKHLPDNKPATNLLLPPYHQDESPPLLDHHGEELPS